MTTEEFLNGGTFDFDLPADAACLDCEVLIQETITGAREVEGGVVCRDCYYARFGEVVEEHPLASSTMAMAKPSV